MKRIFSLLFAVMLAGQAWAQTTFEIDGLKYTVTDETNHYVSVGKAETQPTGALNIPGKVTNPDNSVKYSVTSIDYIAFYGCSGLTSVTIPNSVTSIHNFAFLDCSGLTSVTIPNSVTSIGICAFESCSSLTSVTIPNSVTSIGDEAFRYCSKLTEINVENDNTTYTSENGILFNKDKTTIISYPTSKTGTNYTIPNTVTTISAYAFYGCSDITSITLPNSTTSISNHSFASCSNLTSITIPESVTSIGDNAFCDCKNLASVTIPNSVTSIGDDAFKGCSGIISLTYNTNAIGSAFYDNTSLKIINIGNSVTSIGVAAFRDCSGLTSVTIPESVTSIGDRAFYYCRSLTSINIPNSVTSIGDDAFRGCSKLTSITIPESVTSLGNAAFRDCSGLTSVTIPNSITSIGHYAFEGCRNLTSVTIPKSVESIGHYAFSFCSNLKQITIYATYENGLPPLGSYAFSNNTCTVTVPCGQMDYYKESDWGQYTNFTFAEDFLYEFTANPNNPEMGSVEILQMPDCNLMTGKVKAVANDGYVFVMWDDGRNAFDEIDVDVYGDRHCTAYFAPADADINIIPKNDAFWYYNSDTKMLHIGGHGELSIGIDYMWGDLPKAEVEHVFIEDGFTYINSSTFQNFKALKDVRLPATLKMVGDYSFNGCESLESVVIPEGVTEIEYAAFNGCSSMKYAVLPSTLQKMWSRAFGSCSMLDSIVVKCDTAIDLPSMVFYGGSINTKFYIPCGKKELYTSKECWTINVTSNDNFVETMVYDLSVASSDSKRGTAEIVEMPDCGTAAVVKATAKPNYQFLKWSDGSTANPYEFALEKDLSLTAIFVGKQSEITVEAETNGTVIVPLYAHFEDSVEVKISPKLGYEIDKLTITANGEKLELKNNKFMMPATDVNIAATFKLADYKITVDIKNCKITVPETAHYGDTVMYEIEVDYGYWVSSLSVDYSPFYDKQYFIMPAEDITITGEILRISRIVRYGYDEWREYVGDTVKFDIEPCSGYHVEFEAWNFMSGEIVEVKMVDGTSFIMPDSDIEVSYSYVKGAPVTETAANTINIYAHGNKIVVENATDEIFVYNAMGVLVCRDDACRVRQITVNTPGVYIVKTGGTVKRVVVN